jgi:putative restriction endonuclease
VSPRVRAEFGNGDEFYEREGSVIALPEHARDRPNSEFLTWHMDEVFLSA